MLPGRGRLQTYSSVRSSDGSKLTIRGADEPAHLSDRSLIKIREFFAIIFFVEDESYPIILVNQPGRLEIGDLDGPINKIPSSHLF
jgi:hypothetical protein